MNVKIGFLIPLLFFAIPQSLSAETCCACKGPSEEVCINFPQATLNEVDCGALQEKSNNANVKVLNCSDAYATNLCKPVSSNGKCVNGPFNESVYAPKGSGTSASKKAESQTATTSNIVPPTLNVPIPGLELGVPVQQGKYLILPFLSQYISAVYRYLTGIAVVTAAIMVMYGGFKYIVASTGAQVESGKKTIVDATVGLILILGAYTILNTLNPNLLKLDAIKVEGIRPDPMSYLSGGQDARKTLAELGINPKDDIQPTNLTIPLSNEECPGRDPSYREPGDAQFEYIGRMSISRRNYTIQCNGRQLDEKIINFYLGEQKRTGIPAGVIMAQIVTEASRCAVFDLAEGRAGNIFYNYGGIGCTQAQVPKDSCAHVAFVDEGPYYVDTKKPYTGGFSCTKHNASISESCVSICVNNTRNSFTNCGKNCYPQKSHVSVVKDGREIWIPSVQCSRKFNSPQEFLNAHAGFARFCLPYNDSSIKFAYCIGASTYAGVTGAKGLVLAMIIERNCLCDPKTDSLGCERNKVLEDNLAKNVYEKRNLYNYVKFNEDKKRIPDYEKIVQELFDSTEGNLVPRKKGELNPMDDVSPPE
ncbi:MAG: pilin [bacterium]|nr:pilin [bacterium]